MMTGDLGAWVIPKSKKSQSKIEVGQNKKSVHKKHIHMGLSKFSMSQKHSEGMKKFTHKFDTFQLGSPIEHIFINRSKF